MADGVYPKARDIHPGRAGDRASRALMRAPHRLDRSEPAQPVGVFLRWQVQGSVQWVDMSTARPRWPAPCRAGVRSAIAPRPDRKG